MAQKRDTHEQPLWHVVVVELLFVAVGVAIIYFRDTAGAVAFRLPAGVELAIGLPAGAVTGLAVGLVLTRSRLRAGVMPMAAALRPVVASPVSIVLTGLLAGIGEELLFRAALQPWIGIWWASLVFGVAHGATARLSEGASAGKIVYLMMTFVAGVLLGLLYRHVGLLGSMSAHAAFDIVLLALLAPFIKAAGVQRSPVPATAGMR